MGSSPLARGLPVAILGATPGGGIIPARAGFTESPPQPAPPTPDHPRSRGVYAAFVIETHPGRGSSPLARGLRAPPNRWGASLGIIPARAGFTAHAGSCVPTSPDHPRSRGVYSSALPLSGAAIGSSPLARGLLLAHTLLSGGPRIIPARAGFTSHVKHGFHRRLDHPRSRGVYLDADGHTDETRGSSPLARGLHLRILGIPTMSHTTRPHLPSLLT